MLGYHLNARDHLEGLTDMLLNIKKIEMMGLLILFAVISYNFLPQYNIIDLPVVSLFWP